MICLTLKGIKGSTPYPDWVFGSIGQNVLSPLLVGPILREKCRDAQCISNTTRVCLKALEKHFFLLYMAKIPDTPIHLGYPYRKHLTEFYIAFCSMMVGPCTMRPNIASEVCKRHWNQIETMPLMLCRVCAPLCLIWSLYCVHLF